MTAVDDNCRVAISLRRAIASVEGLHMEQRQVDRSLSYAVGQIDAYTAILRVLKPKDQKTVEKRIAALKEQMGDLS